MINKTQGPIGRRRLTSVALAIGASLAASGSASADESADAQAGRELAVKVCSPCHVVSQPVGPSFAVIAKGQRAEPGALANFLRSTHSDVSHPNGMPTQQLTDRQIEEISAFLATLRGAN
jgi:mono/diheme cytochrome c family protein